MTLDRSHDSNAKSWVASANSQSTDFPIQNLPHGVFRDAKGDIRGGVRIGDSVVDLAHAISSGLLTGEVGLIATAAAKPDLSEFMAMGNEASKTLRLALFDLLHEDNAAAVNAANGLLIPIDDVTVKMPVVCRSFTDFMTSTYHTTSARKSRPERPLHEAFLHIPIGYNSRASTLTPSGVDFERPWGQSKDANDEVVFKPTEKLDFEVEFGAVVGKEIGLSAPVHVDQAEDHIFGYMIVNDWSARDIQLYEMRLGPFLGKSFRSSISPWIVTGHALEPFRCAAKLRESGEPPFPGYLDSAHNSQLGGLNISLDGFIQSAQMKREGQAPVHLVKTHLKHLAWTMNQMLTHLVSNCCNADTGDIFSSGTVSGPQEEEAACLFEKTAGTLAFALPSGEQRLWLEDGDTFSIRAKATKEGFRSIGFGQCTGTVLPAVERWF